MVTAEIITGGSNQGDWFGIAIFFFGMWCVMVILNEHKRRKIKKLKNSFDGKNAKGEQDE